MTTHNKEREKMVIPNVVTHPEAQLAIWLAYHLKDASSDHVTKILNESGCNRRLFVLASVLMAATKPGAIINDQT